MAKCNEICYVKSLTDTLRISRDGKITGIIYFRINGSEFPDPEWNDFVIIVLRWWVEAILNLASGVEVSEDLLFMDGPYLLSVNLNDRTAEIELIEDVSRQSLGSARVRFADLANSILCTAKEVLSSCNKNAWQSEEIGCLEKSAKELDEFLKSS